jgi:hypothetical protein
MNRSTFKKTLLLGSLTLLFACGMDASLPKPPKPEPPGIPVELSTDNQQWGEKYMKPGFEKWAAWHTMGARLASGSRGVSVRPEDRYYTPSQEELQKAVYCFHQAMEAWPKKYPAEADPKGKDRHQSFPKDTLLQKASVYKKLGENELALFYYKLWKEYTPGSTIVDKDIAEVEAKLAGK